jgi:hypothetical protein
MWLSCLEERRKVIKKYVPLIALLVIAILIIPCLAKQENPPGKQKNTGGIWVYDANGNRIGLYVDSGPLLVYIPELDAFTQILPNIPGGPYTGDNWYGNVYTTTVKFDDDDFTTLYIGWGQIRPSGGSHKMLIRDACGAGDQYYISNTEIVSIYQVYHRSAQCTIILEGTPGWYNAYELIPIQITDIPFPVPIVGPFRYQFAP